MVSPELDSARTVVSSPPQHHGVLLHTTEFKGVLVVLFLGNPSTPPLRCLQWIFLLTKLPLNPLDILPFLFAQQGCYCRPVTQNLQNFWVPVGPHRGRLLEAAYLHSIMTR